MTTHLLWSLVAGAAFIAGVVLAHRRVTPAERTRPGAEGAEVRPAPPDAVENLPRALWNLPLGIVVADAQGRVVYRNAVAEGFVGRRHGDALVDAAVNELVAADGGSAPLERRLELFGPPRRHVRVKAAPISDSGQRTGTLVIVEDGTEQHRVDAVRRDFVANVSHELKTPVGAIGVLAEALRGADDPEVVDRLAGRLQDEAIRLGDTIDDLLALSRIESGEVFESAEVDLVDVVVAALERNASAAELRGVALRPPAAVPPVLVPGDRAQLVSAVGNLVDNAVKYSDAGSEVTVSVSVDGDRARVEVVDRGVGIPESDIERIFERFYRVDPARSRETGGTGLGLSIVRHVALNHGGEVTVRSAEGVGSRFALCLPASPPAVVDERRQADGPATTSDRRPAAVREESR